MKLSLVEVRQRSMLIKYVRRTGADKVENGPPPVEEEKKQEEVKESKEAGEKKAETYQEGEEEFEITLA